VASSYGADFRGVGRTVRAAAPTFGCHGFSPWQLRLRWSSGAARESSWSGYPRMRGSPGQPSSAAADPLRPSAGGASPDVATSDTLCRPVGATARSPISRVRRLGSRLSSGVDAPHVARTPDDATRLEATPPMSPGCLPSVRSRSCDRAKPSAFPVTFARKSSHPCHPMRASVSSQDPPPQRATPCNLGLPRGSPRWRGEDASLRPLQPTVDTSTREPLDFRARSSRCTDRRMLPLLPLTEGSGSSVRRRTVLRQSDPGWARA
jgi:hypothetical protein